MPERMLEPTSLIAWIAAITIFLTGLGGCGEPYRAESAQYMEAVQGVVHAQNASSAKPIAAPGESLFWNDCGSEVTCLYMYGVQEPTIVEAIAVQLVRVHARIRNPGVRLTVYSSPKGAPEVLLQEITIK